MHRIPLGPSEMETLIAMRLVAPATIKLIDFKRGRTGAVSSMPNLMKKGLADRHKADMQEPLTSDEIAAGRRLRIGKRPYLYDLTPTGKTVAHHLQSIKTQLNGSVPE